MIRFITLFMFCLPIMVVCQSGDVDKGCVPLTVNFEAPIASNYFWDFGDGINSDLQNPEHIYTSSGVFTVTLYEGGSSGTIVGTWNIEVYPDVVVDLQSDIIKGCVDGQINFQSLISTSPEVVVQEYLWTFGDGARSDLENPSYTYSEEGLYHVSLDVTTNFPDCNKTIIKENHIRVLEARFNLNVTSVCNAPASLIPTGITESSIGYEYIWTLNGVEISQNRNPGTIEITQNGNHSLRLTVRGPQGCETYHQSNVSIGGPELNLGSISKYCLDVPLTISNSSLGRFHQWTFGEDAEFEAGQEDRRQPTVKYTTPGLKTLTYRNYESGCSSDTTFTILIEEALADFYIESGPICGSSIEINLTARHEGMASYTWNGATSPGSEIENFIYTLPQRDAYHINKKELIWFTLEVDTGHGCKVSHTDTLHYQLPESFFIPDSVIGLAPLTIGFTDHSRATDPIVERIWRFEDGTVIEGGVRVEHTFQEGIDQYVQLEIVTASGCRDLSKQTLISALGSSDNDGDGNNDRGGECEFGGGSEDIICVGEPVSYVVDAGLDVHVETDQGRFNHCWNTNSGEHTFMYPGVFPVVVLRETRGFETRRDTVRTITVQGARAEIGYKKTCTETTLVDFGSTSLGADEVKWYYEGTVISTDSVFTYEFRDVGRHQVVLEAISNDSPCPSHRDTVEIYVSDLNPSFSLESLRLCDGVDYLLDASATEGTIETCNPTFQWNFEGLRPRSTTQPLIHQSFLAGQQDVLLTIQDLNGCTASTSIDIEVFGVDPEFVLDSSICLPFKNQFENLTTSDTTIVAWDWSFGSIERAPEFTITEPNMPSVGGAPDSLWIELTMVDALGCVDTIRKMTRVYVPSTSFSSLPSICEGSSLNISTEDFTEEGGQLAYAWTFGSVGTSYERENDIIFNDAGKYDVELVYWPEGTICYDTISTVLNVLETPFADFGTSVDTMDFVCFPHTVSFDNNSIGDSSIEYFWNFDNGSTSTVTDPASSFGRGTYDVSLRVRSNLGCEDIVTQELTFIGPDGDLVVSDDHICLGESVSLELLNPIDISTYDWDLGDGNVISDDGSIEHLYTFVPMGEETTVNLVLKSEDTGCETLKSVIVGVHPVPAVAFESSAEGQDTLCHPFPLQLNATGDDWPGMFYGWDFGNGSLANGANASVLYESGDYVINHWATSSWGCTDSASDSISIVGPDGDFIADNYELCQGDTIRFEVLNLLESSTFEWDFMNDNTVVTDSNVIFQHYAEHPGSPSLATVTLHSHENGCETTKIVELDIHEIEADFELDAEYDYCKGIVRLENNSIGANEYVWVLDEGAVSTEVNPIHTYDRDGEVDVILTATDSATGCSSEVVRTIPITMENEFYSFPNVFSPNGDGTNDLFRIVIPERYLDFVKVTSFKVFDRWGQLLYDRPDQEGWDGNFQGRVLPEDVYAYYLEAEIENCKVVSSKGSVTLVR